MDEKEFKEAIERLNSAENRSTVYVRTNGSNTYSVGGNSEIVRVVALFNKDGSELEMTHQTATWLAAWLLGTVLLQGADHGREQETIAEFRRRLSEAAGYPVLLHS